MILVTWAGEAVGSRAVAAALACAGADSDRAALVIDLAPGRAARPALVATRAARRLEERLAVHRPQAGVASRGQICHLALSADRKGIALVAGSLALARESVCVVHLQPDLLQPLLEEPGFEASGALLRADLDSDRALTALAARDLIDRGLRVMVLKRPLAWLPSRRALFGVLPEGSPGGLPPRLLDRLLEEPSADGMREVLDAVG